MPPKSNKAGQKGAVWTPPPDVDPEAVIDEIVSDAKAGRFELALAKHIWFHHHVLEVERSWFGVRATFALHNWLKLAEKYPPALKAFLKTRSTAERSVKAGKDTWTNFSDLTSIDKRLGDPQRTIRLFEWLTKHDPKGAQRVYHSVEELLVSFGEYELCNAFVSPERFHSIRKLYRLNFGLAKDPKTGDDFDVYAISCFKKNSLRLIRLLALNNRCQEAKSVAKMAMRVLKEESFKASIAEALKVKT